ncbi:MAG: hypothetical protein FJ267_09640 [Planctomycetes bacterium]|nr:hypothetical protein [Planctomycetota bacterium]
MFVTVHRLDQPFKNFPGYERQQKTIAAHPILLDLALNEKQVPNPWLKPKKGAREIVIETGTNLTFATREITATAGEPLKLTLANPDVVPHNWVLVQPGSLQSVGDASNRLIGDPEAFIRQYVPKSETIVAYTDIVSPGERFSISFIAPDKPGRYPYLCTFPGHWMVMNGMMIVK